MHLERREEVDGQLGHVARSPRHLRRATSRWLVGAVAPSAVSAAGPGPRRPPPADLVHAAQIHGVEGWVRRRALAVGVVVPGVESAVRSALARHQRALSDVCRVRDSLHDSGIQWLVVKGPALVHFYDGPDLRSYVDLDILVDPRDVAVVTRELVGAGFELLDVNWPLLSRLQVHELRLLSPSGGAVDLHWALGVGPITDDTSPSFARLLERSRTVVVGGLSFRTLGWADTAVHVAVHAAGSGGHRLIWAADLRAVLAKSPDCEQLILAAREWRASPALDLMLRRAGWAIGMRYPDSLAGRLVPPGPWSWLVAISNQLSPSSRYRSRGSLGRLIARGCGQDSRSSLRQVRRRVFAWWAGGRRDPWTVEQLLDPRDEGSSLFAAGGPRAAEEFFQWVARSRQARG